LLTWFLTGGSASPSGGGHKVNLAHLLGLLGGNGFAELLVQLDHLLVLGSAHMGGIGIGASAGHVAQLAMVIIATILSGTGGTGGHL